jgi:hypothetical protein
VVTKVQDENAASSVTINENVTDDVLSQQSIIKHFKGYLFQRYLVKELQMQKEHIMHFMMSSVVKWLACWPLVPEFAGSNPTEAVGFFPM